MKQAKNTNSISITLLAITVIILTFKVSSLKNRVTTLEAQTPAIEFCADLFEKMSC